MPKIDFKQIFGTTLTDTVVERTPGAGVTIDGVLLKDNEVSTDVINEKTPAAGVTVDGVLLKDGAVAAILAVDGDFTAAQWKNTEPNVATSTNETIQHRWFFGALGSEIEAARVTVGKVRDFTTGLNQDAFMAWSVTLDGSSAEMMRSHIANSISKIGLSIGGTPPAAVAPVANLFVQERVYIKQSLRLFGGDRFVEWMNSTGSTVLGRFGLNVGANRMQIGTSGAPQCFWDRVTGELCVTTGSGPSFNAPITLRHLGNSEAKVMEIRLDTGFGTGTVGVFEWVGGGGRNQAKLRVGRLSDYTSNANADGFMSFEIAGNNVYIQAMRFEGASALVPAGDPRVIIGAAAGSANNGVLQVVSTRTASGLNQYDAIIENTAISNVRLLFRSTGAGAFIQVSPTDTFLFLRLGNNALTNVFCGALIAGTAGGTIGAQVTARSTGKATVGINSGSGFDAVLQFRTGVGSLQSAIIIDASNGLAFTITNPQVAVTDPHMLVIAVSGEHMWGIGNPRVGVNNAPAPLVPTHMLHLRTADTDDGPGQLAVWRFDAFIANAAANLDPILPHSWFFGKPTPIEAIRMTIGKTEDFTEALKESAFIKWEVKNDGVLSEVMRFEGGGGLKFAFLGATPTALDTGWTAFANLLTDRTLDADATTVAELADVLGTLIERLKDKNIISA